MKLSLRQNDIYRKQYLCLWPFVNGISIQTELSFFWLRQTELSLEPCEFFHRNEIERREECFMGKPILHGVK
jgi:hypothetical protein